MKFLLMLQTPSPTIQARDFNAGIIWQTLRDFGVRAEFDFTGIENK